MTLLLPGASVAETAAIPGVWPTVVTHARVSVQPEEVTSPDSSSQPLAAVTSDSTVWAVPWSLLIVIILVVAAIAASCCAERGVGGARAGQAETVEVAAPTRTKVAERRAMNGRTATRRWWPPYGSVCADCPGDVAAPVGATGGRCGVGRALQRPGARAGYVGLCNQAGQQITTGSVSATPFVARAVSSQAAPAGYNGANGTATLMAFLPVQSLPAGDWSGEQITASSIYTNPQSPMAEGTAQDAPLQDFLGGLSAPLGWVHPAVAVPRRRGICRPTLCTTRCSIWRSPATPGPPSAAAP